MSVTNDFDAVKAIFGTDEKPTDVYDHTLHQKGPVKAIFGTDEKPTDVYDHTLHQKGPSANQSVRLQKPFLEPTKSPQTCTIIHYTKKDPVLTKVLDYTKRGWPAKVTRTLKILLR
ncbi:hypothetical protein QE152_g38642 [Popillia japonica]|uniref:Uncharacterized protein n=1 Tax=Popillia japonica TaxID=7064 RepID=A0AAW1HWA3_POPJA